MRSRTQVYTDKGGPVAHEAVLLVTQIGEPPDSSIVIKTFGDGDPRKLIDSLLDALRVMMREDPDFDFKE